MKINKRTSEIFKIILIVVLVLMLFKGISYAKADDEEEETSPAADATPPAADDTPPAADATPSSAGSTPPAAGSTPPAPAPAAEVITNDCKVQSLITKFGLLDPPKEVNGWCWSRWTTTPSFALNENQHCTLFPNDPSRKTKYTCVGGKFVKQ